MRLGRVWVSRNEEWSRADAGIDGHKAGDMTGCTRTKALYRSLNEVRTVS